MRETLRQAILYLDVNGKRKYEDDSMLDFAMLMALQSLELFFYRRAIGGIPPFSTSIERDIEDNDWDRIEQDRVVVSVLDKLGNLLNAQKSNKSGAMSADPLARTKYAEVHRKGLKVFDAKQLVQYREYLKGFYYHLNHNINKALEWYNISLYSGGQYSLNFLRL